MKSLLQLIKITLNSLCQQTGAEWAALLQYDSEQQSPPAILASFGNRKQIDKILENNHQWLQSARSSDSVRTHTLQKSENPNLTLRLFSYISRISNHQIVVAGKGFDTQDKKSWKLFADMVNYLNWQNENDMNMSLRAQNQQLKQELQDKKMVQEAVENRLIQAAKLAAVGELAAGVAHELNNPLTTVSGFAELILDELPDSSPHYEDLKLIHQEAHRARTVVRRLLDFSRQNEILKINMDINEILSNVLALIHHIAEINNVNLSLTFWADLPSIRIDPNQIQQVMLNLIHNAIQAMPEGGNLEIETQLNHKENKAWVTVVIKDSGVGIQESQVEKIFEPFYTTKTSGVGTGLGLSISYRIVSDHGGYIEVKSEEGKGSIFSVWLPVDPIKGEQL